MKTKVIVNPDSKPLRVRDHLRPALHILRQRGFHLSVHFTKGAGEALHVAKRALDQNFDAVVVAGGDGTTNEVINGLIGSGVRLGILPFGGSNVLARELRIPLHPVEAARVLAQKRLRRIDLGLVKGRYFSMMASCGYDAYAVSRTDSRIKKIIHRYAYLWAGLKDFALYKPTVIDVDVNDGQFKDRGTFVVVGNTHLYGGSHEVTPFAEIDDGFLDVCVYQGRYQFGLARFAIGVVSKQHLNMRNVKYYRAKKVALSASKPTLLQVDGDVLGELPMTAEIVPAVLDVFC